jgi:hypothetical protein
MREDVTDKAQKILWLYAQFGKARGAAPKESRAHLLPPRRMRQGASGFAVKFLYD